jgi:actin-related protein
MNNKVLGRHLSSLFALMYAKKLNGSKDKRGTEIVRATSKELIKRNRKMVAAIYPKIERKSREKGEENARRVNGKRVEKVKSENKSDEDSRCMNLKTIVKMGGTFHHRGIQ